MDFNLTGFFWGMPINLTAHSPQDLIKDWLPLLAVFLTALFTYFITSSIQERNHRKDLKRQVYFELIDVITNARKVYDDNRRNPVNEDPKTQTREDLDRMDKEIMVAYTFQAAKFKTYAAGSIEFNNLIDIQLKTNNPIKNASNQEYQRFMKSLTDQMTKELITPSVIEKIYLRLKKWRRKKVDRVQAGALPPAGG